MKGKRNKRKKIKKRRTKKKTKKDCGWLTTLRHALISYSIHPAATYTTQFSKQVKKQKGHMAYSATIDQAPGLSPTAKLRIRPFSKGCRESGTNLIFLHRWGGKVDSRRLAMVVWDERCPFSCFRHFFGFGCHNHGNSLPMYVAPARRWSPVHSRRLHVLRRSFAKLIERRERVLFPSP